MQSQDLKKWVGLFSDQEFDIPPIEVLADQRVRRGQVNLIHHSTGLKVDFVFRKNAQQSIEEFKRRRKVELWPDLQAYLAAPEDVILKKLEYYREGGSQKHLRDIAGILVQTELDLAYLKQWTAELGLQTEWALAQKG